MSAIEWTDVTWNPATGCTRVSPGCANCYIERTVPFRVKHRVFARVGNTETTGVTVHPERLERPFRRDLDRLAERLERPVRVFVNSMSDLFHEEIPGVFVDHVFSVMAAARRHTFQVLTKRPERARDWFDSHVSGFGARERVLELAHERGAAPTLEEWPLRNVWLGVSIENMRFAGRADLLRELPAAVRFISAEPLLGPLVERVYCSSCAEWRREDCADCEGLHWWWSQESLSLDAIDWLIVGGESGPQSRPMHPDWARDLREVAHVADTAFFFKQWGSWIPGDAIDERAGIWSAVTRDGRRVNLAEASGIPGAAVMRFAGPGPKAGGRALDGREWSHFPDEAAA